MLPARWTLRIWLCFCCVAPAVAAQAGPVRVSAWYWLNSAAAPEWERDFRNMRDLGFTDAVLCWGLDAAAFSYRQKDTHRALDLCQRAGLGCYLMIWHPTHNSLPRRPEFQQRDIAGHLRFTFDVFNPRWRNSQWKAYLQEVAAQYKSDPALAGYVFDDSFGIGPIDHFGGAGGPASERVLPGGEKRAGWWEDWARDTTRFLRAVDPDPQHEIYLEDEEHVLSERTREAVGVDFGRVAKHFDAVGAYTAVAWDSPGAGARVATHTREVLEKTRAAIGPDKKIIYTFWAANIAEERKPGPARFPTVDQIRQIADAALQFGIRHLDLYGYRIGDWVVSAEDWPLRRPGTGPTYPITGQFPGKFLYDRREVHAGLRAYLRGLTSPAAQRP
ncbi:MAG TPA: hypothetical protein VEU62_07570 [Bryobacterales bacterium]|nr:hypothetical protein [Bryobacterales bacterium]